MRDDIGGTGGGEKMQAIIATNASAEEIAALVVGLQGRLEDQRSIEDLDEAIHGILLKFAGTSQKHLQPAVR